jgi:hypothetical protein
MSSTQPTRIATNKLKTNPNNPRTIRKDQLEKLVKSLREFPEMLEARPIVVDPDYVVLGGNMRLKAAQEAGLTEVPVYVASWEEAKHKEFVIKDNLAFGEWDWDMLANEWEPEQLDDWGLKVWQPEDDIDMSILDEIDESRALDMTDNVRKAIQVFFEAEDYEEAKNLWSKINKAQVYAGRHIIEAMKEAYEQD